MNIRFSVLMPAYNREKHVGQAIDSVLSQVFKDFELFVIDDGSTDKTLAAPSSSDGPTRRLEAKYHSSLLWFIISFGCGSLILRRTRCAKSFWCLRCARR